MSFIRVGALTPKSILMKANHYFSGRLILLHQSMEVSWWICQHEHDEPKGRVQFNGDERKSHFAAQNFHGPDACHVHAKVV